MNRTHTCRIAALLFAAGLPLAGASAQSICDLVFRFDGADFDQKRQSGSGVVGLPNDGNMYCVPTSCVDQMAYLANHGYPKAVSTDTLGPRDWHAPSMYNYMSAVIYTMGLYEDTDPVNGTGDYTDGWFDYINTNLPNDYFVMFASSFAPDSDLGNPAENMANMMAMGALVNLHIGWFQRQSSHWERVGGHVVNLAGTANACAATPTLLWHDPVSGDSKFSQSTPANSISTIRPVFDVFSWKGDSTNYFKLGWQIDAYTGDTKGFVGGFKALWPNFGIGIDTSVGKLKLYFPKSPASDGASITKVIDFSTLGVGAIRSVDMHPDMTCSVILASQPGLLLPAKLLMVEHADGSVRQIGTLSTAASKIVFSKRGELFACDGSVLKQINLADGSVTKSDTLLRPATGIVYDDAADRIMVLAAADRRIDTYGADLKFRSSLVLPTPVQVGDNSSIAIDPTTGNPWVAFGDSSAASEIIIGATGVSSVSRPLPGTTAPRNIQFGPKGEVLVLDGTTLHELGKDPTSGRYIITNKTGMSGQAFGGFFRAAKTRLAYDPATINRYDTADMLPDFVPDCLVDLNADGQVDFSDYLEFLNRYDAGDLSVDFTGDGLVDFSDYLAFLNMYDAGC